MTFNSSFPSATARIMAILGVALVALGLVLLAYFTLPEGGGFTDNDRPQASRSFQQDHPRRQKTEPEHRPSIVPGTAARVNATEVPSDTGVLAVGTQVIVIADRGKLACWRPVFTEEDKAAAQRHEGFGLNSNDIGFTVLGRPLKVRVVAHQAGNSCPLGNRGYVE